MFDGEGADSCIFGVERYFSINRLTEMEKLEATGVCFEGVTQAWLRFEERSHAFTSWEEFKNNCCTGLWGCKMDLSSIVSLLFDNKVQWQSIKLDLNIL